MRLASKIALGGSLVCLLAVFLLGGQPTKKVPPAGKTEPSRQSDFRIGVKVRMVALDVTVLDPQGAWVDGLQQDDFEIREEGTPQEIALFQKADLPISLGLIIDTSGSMRDRLDYVNESVYQFLARCNPENETFVVDFAHDKAELLQDFTQDVDEVRDSLKEKMIAGGGTPLWDSIYLALEHVGKGKFDRKALLVISDGEDKDSYYDYPALLKKAKQTEVQLYIIGLQQKKADSLFDLSSSSREIARQDMYELTALTGGRVFIPEHLDDLSVIAATLAADLRNQYRIGYHPSEVPNQPTFRRIQVTLKKPGAFRVHTRQGYFQPGVPETK
jgi:Ca-activated chloride channel family protein